MERKTKAEVADPRVEEILHLTLKLASGDLKTRAAPSHRGDHLDAIIMGLNMLAEELSHRVVSLTETEKRLDEILEVIFSIASLDYNKKVKIGDEGNIFDAVGVGLNALGEELLASTVSKKYLDNIIQSMSDMLLVATPELKIRTVNQAALDTLGYRESELIDRPLAVLFEKEFFKKLDFEGLSKTGSIRNMEAVCLGRNGDRIPVSFSGSVMRDEGGPIQGIVCVIHDITEKKLLEEERQMRQEKLLTLGQLAGGVGHELRNPLSAIKNAAYFLNMSLEHTDPEIKEALEILKEEVLTSERIIGSLLDFARARGPLRRKTDLTQVLQVALTKIKVPPHIEVEARRDESLPAVLADPDQLVQAFDNILLNAVQAMPDGGRLTIKSETLDPEWVALSFTDTGAGISEENRQRIFEPLFTGKAKGIGLGMAITRTFVEGHGGSISVQSEVGKGSTFTVKLPVSGKQ